MAAYYNEIDPQAAAQADYERRILSALEPAAPATDAEAFESCPDCAGSGYSNHPDSGQVCYRCNGQGSYTRPPEPATDVEPVAWSYEVANYIDNDGSYTGWVGPRLSFQKPNAPEGSIRNATPLYTRPPESRLREALEFYADSENWKQNGPLDPNSGNFTGGPARAALAQGGDDERIRREMDEVLRKQSERDIPFAPATRPAEQAVTEKMVQAHKEGKPIESCSRDYSSKDWYLCSTLSTRGRTMGSWQPIETAPKDGTPILAVVSGVFEETGDPFIPDVVEWDEEQGRWWREDFPVGSLYKPTHWQPLPAPPKEDGK